MQITSWPRWLRIVSTQIAVLPVVRSPMISSRWPRPIGIIESIAFRPVWSGSFTGWRWTTPGALNSSGRRSEDSIGPWPSTGFPSGSTMRPISASPTGTLATRPVRRTGSPSLTFSHSPSSAQPTLSSSRLSATPVTPCSNSSISSATALSRPYTRAMPSPTCSTWPTSARSVSTSKSLIRSLRRAVISSGRSFKTWLLLLVCGDEILQPGEVDLLLGMGLEESRGAREGGAGGRALGPADLLQGLERSVVVDDAVALLDDQAVEVKGQLLLLRGAQRRPAGDSEDHPAESALRARARLLDGRVGHADRGGGLLARERRRLGEPCADVDHLARLRRVPDLAVAGL